MIRVNVRDAKTHLSRHLERVESGETVVICRRNVPIAEIRPLRRPALRRRRLGEAKGSCRLSPQFDSLPDEIVAAFEGGAG